MSPKKTKAPEDPVVDETQDAPVAEDNPAPAPSDPAPEETPADTAPADPPAPVVDERTPEQKDPGPAPLDAASLQVASLPEAHTLETVSQVVPSNEELAKLDEVDAARAASLRKQRDWAEDSKQFFKRESQDEIDRKAMIEQMDAMDVAERRRVDAERKERERQAELETREQRISEIRAKLDEMSIEARGLVAEMQRLQDLEE